MFHRHLFSVCVVFVHTYTYVHIYHICVHIHRFMYSTCLHLAMSLSMFFSINFFFKQNWNIHFDAKVLAISGLLFHLFPSFASTSQTQSAKSKCCLQINANCCCCSFCCCCCCCGRRLYKTTNNSLKFACAMQSSKTEKKCPGKKTSKSEIWLKKS